MKNNNPRESKNIHSFFVFINQLYLKVDDIYLVLQLPKTFVASVIQCSFNKEDYFYLKDSYWITYDKLSKADFRPYNITTEIELKARYFANFKKSRDRQSELVFIYESLAIAVRRPPNISAIFTDLEQRSTVNVRALTYTYNAFSFLIGLKQTTDRECFLLYTTLLHHVDETIDYCYKSKSLDSFKAKLHNFRTFGIKVILHKYWHNQNAAIKFSTEEIGIMKDNFENGNLLSFRQTCCEINMSRILKGQKRVSVQTVINKTKSLKEYSKLFMARQGSDVIEKVVIHYNRLDADFPGDQYQADGTRYPFPYKTEDGRIGYLTLIAAIDIFSRKIVGYRLALSETFASYFEILKQSIIESNKLPAELVIDNHKTLHTEKAQLFFGKLTSMGVIVRYCKVKNPQDKAHIENFFNVLNMMYSKRLDGYQGENLPSRREGAHPNNDLRKFFTQPKKLRTRSEVEELIKTEIDSYNGTYEIKNSVPRLLFSNSAMKHAIQLDANLKRVLLYEERLVTLHQVGVAFTYNNHEYQYPIALAQVEKFYEYLEKELIIRFDPENLQRIYLYKVSTYTVICELELHVEVPIALVTHTANDRANLLKAGLERKALKKTLTEYVFADKLIKAPTSVVNDKVKSENLTANKSITNKQPIKIVIAKKNEIFETTVNPNQEHTDPKVIELKLALSQLFKVNGSNKAIN